MKLPTTAPPQLEENLILHGLGGSRSYGTDMPTSDTDYRGVAVIPQLIDNDPFTSFEQYLWKSEDTSGRVSEQAGMPEAASEGVVYSTRKFFQLAASCNPNVLEILYLRPEDYTHISPAGQLLIDNRTLFLSQLAAKTFCGYARSQIHRIQGHYAWISTPPKAEPRREDFDLPPLRHQDSVQLGAVDALMRQHLHLFAPWLLQTENAEREEFWNSVLGIVNLIIDTEGTAWDPLENHWMNVEAAAIETASAALNFSDDFQERLRREKAFSAAFSNWQKYQNWLRNRNPARAEIEARYGYDCKHAMHAIRLLRMGEELLTTATFAVYRPDAEELKAIRNGSIPYEDLITLANQKVESLYALVRQGKTVLPPHPDKQALALLHNNIIQLHRRGQ
jgi:predicted nucleotidyltransferase